MFRDAPALPSRRTVVLLGAAVPFVGCTVIDGEPEATAPPVPHPDEAVRDGAVAAESELIALYAAAAEHPDLAEQLDPFRLRHEEHLAAMSAATIPSDPSAPSHTGAPAPQVARPSVSPDPAAALDEVRAAESAAAEARLADCLDSRGRALATVLASVAAAEAAHAELLRGMAP